MRRTLLLLGSATVDATPASRRWARERLAAELLTLSSADRIIATSPLDFLRFSLGTQAPSFVFLSPSGAIHVDGRDVEQRWVGSVLDVLVAYKAAETGVRALVFTRLGDDEPDAHGLDAQVHEYKETSP